METADFNKIKAKLGVSEKVVLSLLGASLPETVNEHRLVQLDFIVDYLSKKSMPPHEIIRVITIPSYKSNDDTYLDVVTAIHCGDYSNDDLKQIASANIK